MSISNIDLTVDTLQTPAGIKTLNSMLNRLSRLVSGDGESVRIIDGFGSPESAVVAGIGSIYMRKDGSTGSTIYIKESGTGATGWISK